MKILLVDDSVQDSRVYTSVLRNNGYDTVVAQNGIEALSVLEEQEIAMVFLDLVMPVMRGQEFLSILRGNKKYDQIPIVVMSSNKNMDEVMTLMEEEGAQEFLHKPLRPIDMINAIKKFLKE